MNHYNENVDEYFDVIPDTTLMIKAGSVGYSFSDMVAELVDNSIDAAIEGEKLIVEIKIDTDRVTVEDNASGMTKEELKDAVVLAKAAKIKKLGLYGLGLKTSCVALGNYFGIETTPAGTPEKYITWWDKEEWQNLKEWKFPLRTEPEDRAKHGTIVIIEKLKIKVGNKINQLRGDLGRRFAPFINRGIVDIIVNEVPCKAIKPEIMEETKKIIDITTSDGNKITGWVALLKNSSQKGEYGFDTFRYGRMITYYDKIGFTPHPSVARIVGELHMDHIPVISSKLGWEIESREYQEAVKLIKENIKDIINESRRLASEKSINNIEKNKLEQYKEGIAKAIKSEYLKDYVLPEREYIERKNGYLEIEKRDESENPKTGTVEPKHTGRKRIPQKIQLKKTEITVKGKKFYYEHRWEHHGSNAASRFINFDNETRKLEVISNLDFPAVYATRDRAFLAFLHIVEAIANIMVREANADWDKYEEIKEILMREASKHVAELED